MEIRDSRLRRSGQSGVFSGTLRVLTGWRYFPCRRNLLGMSALIVIAAWITIIFAAEILGMWRRETGWRRETDRKDEVPDRS